MIKHDLTPLYATWRLIDHAGPEVELCSADTLSMDDVTTDRTQAQTDVIVGYEAPATAWGDYSGSDVDRSNGRSLVRDYPESFVRLTGWYGSEYLMVLPAALEDEETDLVEVLTALRDEYPVYDEDDWSMLTMEMEQEDWDSWGRSDMRSTVVDTVATLIDQDFDESELLPDGRLDELFWEAQQDASCGYEAETAVGGYWPGFEETGKEIGRQLAEEIKDGWVDWARSCVRGPLDVPLPI